MEQFHMAQVPNNNMEQVLTITWYKFQQLHGTEQITCSNNYMYKF